MRILLLSWLFFILFLVNFFGIDVVLVSGKCRRDQQLLLLQMKKSLKFNSNLSVNLVKWNQGIDCCHWSGIVCDGTGRVISLDLGNEAISGGIENVAGLFSLGYLQRLNLSFNDFNGTQIPSRLANLKNLIYLNLSYAHFAGQIPIEISYMSSLVTLDLSTTQYGSPLLKLENPNLSLFLQNLRELRELYLDGINISTHGDEWCQAISASLPKLQVLSLSSCFLSGPIHHSLANLESISKIRLDENNLSLPVPEFFANFLNLTSLRLSNCGLNGKFPEKILQVPTLETVDLSSNHLLQGSLPNFPKNHSLRILMLSNTKFSGTLPESIGNLKNLSTIDLANCSFTGLIPTSMANLTHLVYLSLSQNNFSGPIPSLQSSRNLTSLDISYNAFTGPISSISWEQLSRLVYVILRDNSLNGSVPQSLFSLPSLEQLLLANNLFGGRVPEFSNAPSSVLVALDLNGNRFEGPIPTSIFELEKLNILVLSSNKFNGTVQLDKFKRLGNLTRLDLSYNNLSVNAISTDYTLLPRISNLGLASCKLSMIPNLKSRSKLFYLNLSKNQISGEIPNWIWEVGNGGLTYLNLSHNLLMTLQKPYSIPNLSVLDLHSNKLQGNIPQPPSTAVYLDYSSNFFNSSIPADIGNILFVALFFSLSNNSLTGVIPESFCSATYLQVLDLSNNHLVGRIPTCLIEKNQALGVLNLRRNKLRGTISGTFPGDCGLQTLNLNGNQLEGTIPKSLDNCKRLEVLDLGDNEISDKFPCWLKNVSSLRVLVLRSNKFYGEIDCPHTNSSWPMLQIVDLASNNFSGRLPQKWLTALEAMMVNEDEAQSRFKHLGFEFLRLDKLSYWDTVTITGKGLEIELVKILTLFTVIDLSCNNFQGPIPKEMGQFRALYILNLSHNALSGSIPSFIGNLRQLESLDLSMNNLSGPIPSQLSSLNFLAFLNLSYNHLEGTIPLSGQLQTFSSSSYEGNTGLCGFPLPKNCTNSSKPRPSESASSNEIDWMLLVTGTGFGIGSAVIVAPLMFSKRANKLYDNQIDKFLMVILPMVGLTYTSSHERSVEAEENLEDEIADEDDDELETEEFCGRYCVFCSKLDITRKKVVHDPKCTCPHSPPISSSSTSSSSSSLAHFDKT